MTSRAPQLFKDRCLLVVQDLARKEGWELPPEGLDALVEAILPFVHHAADPDDAPDPDVRLIRTIARNYYLDGPMVQEMLTQGSLAGEQLWTEWRGHFVSVARWKGLSLEDAEDLIQDVYLQTSRALRTFRFESRLKTYFYSIFNRHYVRWLLGQPEVEPIPIDEKITEGRAPGLAIRDKSPLPEEEVIRGVENAEIRKLVEHEIRKIVNSVDFLILYLYFVEQTYIDEKTGEKKRWTDKAIGERLEMPLNTVTSKRRRALQRLPNNPRLRKAWKELGGLETQDVPD